jgi:uncharacterized protein (TIGR02271 family)
MPLQRIGEFDPDYTQALQGNDLKGMSVYTQGTNEKIGSVSDVVVDHDGKFRYLVLDLGLWNMGKKVMLPIGRASIDSNANRVSVGITKQQAETLPEYKDSHPIDYDYEERVRGVYRTAPLETSAPLEASAPLDATTRSASTYDRNTYTYEQDADLYGVGTGDQTIRLYEERLIAGKQRRKTGEVTIGKHVETETERVAVSVDKERVVIERVTPADAGRAVAPGEAAFREGEVAHVEIYEETPDIQKEAFVREEVRVSKVVDHETVQAQETVRREELDIDTQGRPIVDRPPSDRI